MSDRDGDDELKLRRSQIAALRAEVAALKAEVLRLRRAGLDAHNEICQTLGRALGYPRYCDDQENFPGTTDANGVCVGDHVAESIAVEAARAIGELRAQLAALDAAIAAAYRGKKIELLRSTLSTAAIEAIARHRARQGGGA